MRFTAALVAVLLLFPGCRSETTTFDLSGATYVGRDSCVRCHQQESDSFAGSHHDLAMHAATTESVLGDFDDARLEHHGIESRMFRDGDTFWIHTEGPDGEMQDFQIKYVFGVEPLQQYMVEFPAAGQSLEENESPRIQVLRICWNTEDESWFYLPPPDVPERLDPQDDLHWTGIAQRWNNMCADCHSTNFQKNFVIPDSHAELAVSSENSGAFLGEYHSTFSEIDVSCESCHGPASVHVELAQQYIPGWNRTRGYGLANLKLSTENHIQTCAPCHSRRNIVQGGFQPGHNFYDHFANQLLTEDIYYPDGQILDEDYVHGSFIQSKMYHKGIQCSDCHDPHTARLKHNGNQVCTSCHQHPAAKYDTVAHHFHKPDTDGAQCVNCHMPSTTYMAVDARRDHSLRIPRPDLSLQIDVPNACTGCHLELENVRPEIRDQLVLYQDWMRLAKAGDQEVQAELDRANLWCDQACDQWYGENRRRDDHFGLAIAAGQTGQADAVERLSALLRKRGFEAPAIARATALQVLSQVDREAAADLAARAISDDHPLVRAAATSALTGGSNITKNASLLQAALSDPVRNVRIEAARNLLEFPQSAWRGSTASDFRQALAELQNSLQFNNDRAGAHLAMGILAEQQGRNQQAIQHYQDSIAVEPNVTGGRTNLAALLERNLAQLRPDSAAAQNLEQRIRDLRKAELPLLQRDAGLLPDSAALQYRLGLALYVDQQLDEAIACLVRAAELEPEELQYAQAVAMLYETRAQWAQALEWGQRAVDISNGDSGTTAMFQRIRAGAAAAGVSP